MASSPFFSDLVGTQLKANSGQSGLTGLAAGLVFKRVWRRSPLFALALGGAYIYYQSVQAAKQAKAKKVIKQQGLHGATENATDPQTTQPQALLAAPGVQSGVMPDTASLEPTGRTD